MKCSLLHGQATRVALLLLFGCFQLDKYLLHLHSTQMSVIFLHTGLRFQLHQFSSVAQSCPVICDPVDWSTPGIPVHHQLLKKITPEDYSNSCPSSQRCPSTISSSVGHFSSHLRSFPASGPFTMSPLFTSGDWSIGVSASASVLPMNIQDWFSLGWIAWISLQSKGLSSIFSNNTVQKHQFFSIQLSLWPNSHIHTWLLEKS